MENLHSNEADASKESIVPNLGYANFADLEHFGVIFGEKNNVESIPANRLWNSIANFGRAPLSAGGVYYLGMHLKVNGEVTDLKIIEPQHRWQIHGRSRKITFKEAKYFGDLINVGALYVLLHPDEYKLEEPHPYNYRSGEYSPYNPLQMPNFGQKSYNYLKEFTDYIMDLNRHPMPEATEVYKTYSEKAKKIEKIVKSPSTKVVLRKLIIDQKIQKPSTTQLEAKIDKASLDTKASFYSRFYLPELQKQAKQEAESDGKIINIEDN